MINPAFDGVVWAVAFLFLALMGARAWAVETTPTRVARTTRRVRGLTAAAVLAFVALAGLLTVQGGALFVDAVVTAKTGGDPQAVLNQQVQQQPAGPAGAPVN